MSITIHNKKIIDFYQRNPSFHIETINLQVIDLLEHIIADMHSTLDTTIQSQILNEVHTIKEDVSKLERNMTNSIFIKFQESKKEYLDEIKNTMHMHLSDNREKVQSLLHQHTSQMIDKTNILLNEIIPKTNDCQEKYFQEIKQHISLFQSSISHETQQLALNVSNQDSLKVFSEKVETNYTSLIQTICTYMNASEERINQNLSTLKQEEKQNYQENIMQQLSEFLNKYRNSSYKGQFGENKLETVLNDMYPSAYIQNTTGTKASCDFLLQRDDKPSILFETKNYDRNVNLEEVKKFVRDIEEQEMHGIFLSQSSGITSKQNFHIDIKGKLIMVYLHKVDYNPQMIKCAIDIIDTLSDKLEDVVSDTSEMSISKDVLEEINREYSSFAEKKISMMQMMKEQHKRLVNQFDELQMPVLSKFLNVKYGSVSLTNPDHILCDICNKYYATNNKSLAAHKRGCIKKLQQSVPPNVSIQIP